MGKLDSPTQVCNADALVVRMCPVVIIEMTPSGEAG
jgi:hypothetical protein